MLGLSFYVNKIAGFLISLSYQTTNCQFNVIKLIKYELLCIKWSLQSIEKSYLPVIINLKYMIPTVDKHRDNHKEY